MKKVKDLKANPKNPRVITEAKLAQLGKSMDEYGDLSGIVFNRRTGNVVGGTQRTRRLDADSKVVITKTYEKPTKRGTVKVGYILLNGERFSYREVDWDRHREMAANIAANKGAGEWDLPQLGEWVKELGSFDVDFDLSLTMFDHDELKQFGFLTTTVSEHERGLGGADEETDDYDPEPPEEPEKLLGEVQLFNADNLAVMRGVPDNTFDSVVTDPPYGWRFMGKAWDGFDTEIAGNKAFEKFSREWATEAFRILKPGGHIIVFCGPRTYHRMASGVEDAGFEVRDQLQWLFGSGFPKSLDISKAIDRAAGAEREIVGVDKTKWRESKNHTATWEGKYDSYDEKCKITNPATAAAAEWEGWGTALKPANEPILLARKPISEKTVAANVLKWGTGALNIDASRIAGAVPATIQGNNAGRFPANLVLDEAAAELLDAQTGITKGTFSPPKARARNNGVGLGTDTERFGISNAPDNYGDTGGASRFFYVAKASKTEKNTHCWELPEVQHDSAALSKAAESRETKNNNNHPTVKPVSLMRYLTRLVTPPGGLVLDPFMGSGSTGVAVLQLGLRFVGIEREADYFKICKKRLNLIANKTELVKGPKVKLSKSILRKKPATQENDRKSLGTI